jgi:cytidylate kinase
MNNVIAIDGPAASGKGTLARALAAELGYAYMDTGRLYRAVGMALIRAGRDPGREEAALEAAQSLRSHFDSSLLDDPALGGDEAGTAASQVSAFQGVRDALLGIQQDFAATPPGGAQGAVMDGRDIGTVVCPHAGIKLFVTAEPQTRAARRYKELQSKGINVTYEAVLADMQRRDARDTDREAAPLKAAHDARTLDTTHLDADQALEKALEIVRSA